MNSAYVFLFSHARVKIRIVSDAGDALNIENGPLAASASCEMSMCILESPYLPIRYLGSWTDGLVAVGPEGIEDVWALLHKITITLRPPDRSPAREAHFNGRAMAFRLH